jgi:vancomycin permeability regulator SanA
MIVSGGSPAHNSFTEGMALRETLIQLGVDPQHIVLDSFSQNT